MGANGNLTPKERVKRWSALLPKLKEKFLRMGITSCELALEGCWRTEALSWAHSVKRRHASTMELLEEVILACTPCHDRIEKLGEAEMSKIVRRVIAERGH